LSEPWDKYETKRRDKVKPESCRSCVFDKQCSGVFDTYRRFYGFDELRPITSARLPVVDPEMRLFTLHAEPLLAALEAFHAGDSFRTDELHVDTHAQQIVARYVGAGGVLRVALCRPGGGLLSTDRFSLHVLDGSSDDDATHALVRRLFDALAGGVDARLARCIARLGAGAPYGALSLRKITLESSGREALVELHHGVGVGVTVTLSVQGPSVRGGYRLDRELPSPPEALVADVRAAMVALRG